MPQTLYTQEEFKRMSSEKEVWESMISQIMTVNNNQRMTPAERREAENKDFWHYIPNYNLNSIYRDFNKVFKLLNKDGPSPKFLELGSGLGIYTILAEKIGFEARGIEFDKSLVDFANKMFYNDLYGEKPYFIHGDIMNHAKKISKADLLYFYSPFREKGNKAADFIDFVVKNMKPGAYVYMATHCSSESKKIRKLMDKGTIKNVNKKDGDYAINLFQKVGKTQEEVSCDNTDHNSDFTPKRFYNVTLTDEFEGDKCVWCSDCVERDNDMIETKKVIRRTK